MGNSGLEMTEERKREANSRHTKHETAVGAEVDSELYLHPQPFCDVLVPDNPILQMRN